MQSDGVVDGLLKPWHPNWGQVDSQALAPPNDPSIGQLTWPPFFAFCASTDQRKNEEGTVLMRIYED